MRGEGEGKRKIMMTDVTYLPRRKAVSFTSMITLNEAIVHSIVRFSALRILVCELVCKLVCELVCDLVRELVRELV